MSILRDYRSCRRLGWHRVFSLRVAWSMRGFVFDRIKVGR